MKKIQIKSRFTDNIILEIEAESFWEANLTRANLTEADLTEADLRGAIYGINILCAHWREVPDELIIELMRWDASFHPDGQRAYSEWAKGGKCPATKFLRMFNFQENRKLWKKGKPKMTLAEVMAELFKHAHIKWDGER